MNRFWTWCERAWGGCRKLNPTHMDPKTRRIAAYVLVVIAGAVGFYTQQRTSNRIDDTAEANRILVHRIANLQEHLRRSQIGQCQRQNIARSLQVQGNEIVAESNRARARVWAELGEAIDVKPVHRLTLEMSRINQSEADRMQRIAEQVVNSQHAVAAFPGARRLKIRAYTDCQEVYSR